jgi:hypothetical protein
MPNLRIPLVVCSLLVSSLAASAQESAPAIVERAIEAQGGTAKVTKLRTMRIKVEGTTNLVSGQPNLPFTIEDTWQMPDRYKTTSTFRFQGKTFSQTQVVDGDKGWIQSDGQVQNLSEEALKEIKEQKYAEDLDRLGFSKEKGIELSTLDEIKVDGMPAVGVLVKSKGHRDVSLYFDKASGLLVKRDQRVLDPSSDKEVRQEVVFADYQEKGGVKHYTKIVAFRDGKQVVGGKVTEVDFLEGLDAKVFAKPSD